MAHRQFLQLRVEPRWKALVPTLDFIRGNSQRPGEISEKTKLSTGDYCYSYRLKLFGSGTNLQTQLNFMTDPVYWRLPHLRSKGRMQYIKKFPLV